jgi:hypothetical protein
MNGLVPPPSLQYLLFYFRVVILKALVEFISEGNLTVKTVNTREPGRFQGTSHPCSGRARESRGKFMSNLSTNILETYYDRHWVRDMYLTDEEMGSVWGSNLPEVIETVSDGAEIQT